MKRRFLGHLKVFPVLALAILLTMGVCWQPPAAHALGSMTLAISSAKLGNIFADGDAVDFTLTFTNPDAVARTMNGYWTAADQNGVQAGSGSFQQLVGASASASRTLSLSAANKGTYTLSVHAVSTDNAVDITQNAYFSRVLALSANRGDGPFGVNTHWWSYTPSNYMPLADLAGVQWTRDTVDWNSAESTKGVVTIPAQVDDYVNSAVAKGINPILVLAYGNALYDQTTSPFSADFINGFTNYARTVVSHFAGKVKYFEIWNEFDQPTFNPPGPVSGTGSHPAADYAQLIKAAYPVIKQANPNAVVIGGVMSWAYDAWLKQVFDAGAFNFMDVLSFHYYAQPRTPEVWGMKRDIDRLYNLMTGYGAAKPIWITESGVPISSQSWGFTDRKAAATLVRTYSLALASNKVSKLFWYDFQNDGTNPADPEHHMGMLRNWADPVTPYAANTTYIAYSALSHKLVGASFSADYSPDADLYIHKYHRISDNKDVLVVWSLDGSDRLQLNVGSPSNVTVTDMYGNSATAAPVNNVVTIVADDAPQYIEGTIPGVTVVSRVAKASLNGVSPSSSDGLAVRAGDSGSAQVVTAGGRTAWKIPVTGPAPLPYCIYGNVNDAYILGGTNTVDVAVDYYDQGTGKFTMQYDSPSNAFKEAETVQLAGTNTWKTHVFRLYDARFNNQTNGDDFRVSTWGLDMGSSGSDVIFGGIRVKKISAASVIFGSTPVYNGIVSATPADSGSLQQVTLGGKTAWKTNLAAGPFGININADDNMTNPYVAKTAEITVEYYDSPNGKFTLQYDSTSNAFKEAEAVHTTGTNKWLTHTFVLNDAILNNHANANDFRISAWGSILGTSATDVAFASASVKIADGRSVTLAAAPTINGITPRAGDTGTPQMPTLGGRQAWTASPSNPYCIYGNIDDSFIHGGLNAVELTVQYFDQGTGKFTLAYDTAANHFQEAETVNLTGTNTWKSYTFQLQDAQFNNQCNGDDFRVTLWAPNMGSSGSDVSFSDFTVVKKPH